MDTFSMGGVVGRVRRILALHPLGFIILAAVVVVLPGWIGPLLAVPIAADLRIAARSGQSMSSAAYVYAFLIGAAPELVKFLGNLILTATIAVAAWRDAQGLPKDFGACLRAGLGVFVPMLGLSILSGLAITLGSLLLIVPGIILTFMWFVVNQVYAVERPGISAAFGRSRFLTSGYRWRLLGIALLFALAVLVVVIAAVVVEYMFVSNRVGGGIWVFAVIGSIGLGLFNIVTAAGLAAIYIELRRAKDGFLSRDLVDAFA